MKLRIIELENRFADLLCGSISPFVVLVPPAEIFMKFQSLLYELKTCITYKLNSFRNIIITNILFTNIKKL